MGPVWIAVLRISDRTAAKIRGVHRVEPAELRDALVGRPGLQYVWDEDPERGLRAIVQVTVGRRDVLVVLYPAGDDVWDVGSAYPVSD